MNVIHRILAGCLPFLVFSSIAFDGYPSLAAAAADTEPMLVPKRTTTTTKSENEPSSTARRRTTKTNEVCDLALFVSFFYNETVKTNFEVFSRTSDEVRIDNLGFSHMAAAALAMEHFNQRTSAVVPNLGDIISWSCPNLQLSFRGIYDTVANTHSATNSLFADLEETCQEKLSTTAATDNDKNNDNDNMRSSPSLSAFIPGKDDISVIDGSTFTTPFPCAMVGAYFELPAQILGTMAAGSRTPLTTVRSYNLRASDPYFSPFTNLIYPDLKALVEVLVNFLQFMERTNYIAILHKLGDTPVQILQIATVTLERFGIDYREYGFRIPTDQSNVLQNAVGSSTLESLSYATERIKEEGFRTIVCIMENPELEINFIAQAVDYAGINTGDYFWIFVGVDLSVFSMAPVDLGVLNLRLLAGAAVVSPLEGFQVDPEDDPFMNAWKDINDTDFIDYVNDLSLSASIENVSDAYQASDDYFQYFPPAPGSGFMYDAIMATGLGACMATEQTTNSEQQRRMNLFRSGDGDNGTTTAPTDAIPSWHKETLLNSIRKMNFSGATGIVSMNQGSDSPGRRNSSYLAKFGVVNMFPTFANESNESRWYDLLLFAENDTRLFQLTHILNDNGTTTMDTNHSTFAIDLSTATWIERTPFVFRSGSTTPPSMLRDLPEQNYLNRITRISGLLLMCCTMLGCIMAAIWLYVNRNERIVKSSQPIFMYSICFGSLLEALAIYPLSHDESNGWSQVHLSCACMAIPWLTVIGFMITYGALFSKLWRVNRVLQFKRTVVSARVVSRPSIMLCLLSIGLLVALTIWDPLLWDRKIINEFTGESIGRCDNEHFAAFITPVAILMILLTSLVGIMAWKTNDVDSEFSESYWIFYLIIVQLEVAALGIPIVSILRDLDSNGRYWGMTFTILSIPSSTISFLMVPKIWTHRQLKLFQLDQQQFQQGSQNYTMPANGGRQGRRKTAMRGGPTGVTRISGLVDPRFSSAAGVASGMSSGVGNPGGTGFSPSGPYTPYNSAHYHSSGGMTTSEKLSQYLNGSEVCSDEGGDEEENDDGQRRVDVGGESGTVGNNPQEQHENDNDNDK